MNQKSERKGRVAILFWVVGVIYMLIYAKKKF